uniref:SAND domain-containing protein n=1 Tax=Caenorhabditis japonica TaxID=281687 RepID=A0A8R1HWY6_CAEJA
MKNEGDVMHDALSPPPPPIPTPDQFHAGDGDEVAKSADCDKASVYPVMYSQSQYADPSYAARPITPLQITISEGSSSPTVPVSCGTANGKMHLNMFVCPGIHQLCIEMGSEYDGQPSFDLCDHSDDLLTPKQFTVRGDKERQKDWKASIRVGRSSLRTHMEAQTIDFYDHSNRCSGKCQSRNYVNAPVERDEVIQSRKAKRNADVTFLKNEIENEISGKEVEEKKPTNGKKARGRPRGSVNKPRVPIKPDPADEQFFDEFFTDVPPQMVLPPDQHDAQPKQHLPLDLNVAERNLTGCSSFSDILGCLQEDPLQFWTQMQNNGVIGHFCDDLIVTAINLKQTACENPVNAQVANMLTRGCFALGAQNVIVHRVQSIERSVHQQRKHDEMLSEIQSKVAEEQRLKNQSGDACADDLQTAKEIVTDSDDFIDVVKFEDFPTTSAPTFHAAPAEDSVL